MRLNDEVHCAWFAMCKWFKHLMKSMNGSKNMITPRQIQVWQLVLKQVPWIVEKTSQAFKSNFLKQMASKQLALNIATVVEPKTKRKYKNEKDKNVIFKELATLGKAMSCAKRRLKA